MFPTFDDRVPLIETKTNGSDSMILIADKGGTASATREAKPYADQCYLPMTGSTDKGGCKKGGKDLGVLIN